MTAYNFVSLQQNKSPWFPGHVYKVGGYFDLSTTSGAAGLANGDTITATGMIPEGGVKALEVVVLGAPADTNASPTGTFSLGDSLTDSNHAARYILAGSLAGASSASTQFTKYQNVTPTITAGAYVKGVGFQYTTNENSNGESGFVDIVLTVTNSMASAATSGILYVYVTYICTGDI